MMLYEFMLYFSLVVYKQLDGPSITCDLTEQWNLCLHPSENSQRQNSCLDKLTVSSRPSRITMGSFIPLAKAGVL